MTETQKLRDKPREFWIKNTKIQVGDRHFEQWPVAFEHRSFSNGIHVIEYSAYALANESAQKEIEELKKNAAMLLTVRHQLYDQLTASNARCEELEAEIERLTNTEEHQQNKINAENEENEKIAKRDKAEKDDYFRTMYKNRKRL